MTFAATQHRMPSPSSLASIGSHAQLGRSRRIEPHAADEARLRRRFGALPAESWRHEGHPSEQASIRVSLATFG